MSTTRIELQPAHVLHRRPYRDTSLLVEAFSRDHGRVGLVAKGVRRGRGNRAGLLQAFQPLLLSWSGRGELATLTAVEAAGPATVPGGPDLYAGFYLNELLLRLLRRHDPHPELYAVYAEVVRHVAAGNDVEWALRLFEVHLLEGMGYGLSLLEQGDGGPLEPEACYRYRLESGPVPATAGADGIEVHGRTLLALAHGAEPDARVRDEAKRLLRAALRLYLGDRPLKSRELYRTSKKIL